VADRTGLENRSTRKGTQGSNPCLSAFDSRYKRSDHLRNPEFSRGFFAFMASGFACHDLHSRVQVDAKRCKKWKIEWHQYRHLGTTVGTYEMQFYWQLVGALTGRFPKQCRRNVNNTAQCTHKPCRTIPDPCAACIAAAFAGVPSGQAVHQPSCAASPGSGPSSQSHRYRSRCVPR